MYLFYLDESGDPSSWNDQDNFILAGVAVHEGQVRNLSTALGDVQRRFLPGIQVPVELHTQHIRAGKGRFRDMAKEQREDLLLAAYDVLSNADFPRLIGFASAIHIGAVQSPEQAFRTCLEDICECFNSFLVREFKAGHKHKGLLIIDRSGREGQVRELMADFERHGTTHGYLGNIVDVPYFAESKQTRMLQLADLLAFAVSRYLNAGDPTYIDRVFARFDRSSRDSDVVGFRHIVAASHRCDCGACHTARTQAGGE